MRYMIGFSALLLSCSPAKEDAVNTSEEKLDGKVLMEERCYTCHNTHQTDNMLAPPMQRVKDHYYDDDISREEFVEAIVEWCADPNEEKSIMPGARRKFGLMPKQNFDAKEVRAIAEYLFDNDPGM